MKRFIKEVLFDWFGVLVLFIMFSNVNDFDIWFIMLFFKLDLICRIKD